MFATTPVLVPLLDEILSKIFYILILNINFMRFAIIYIHDIMCMSLHG